MRRFIAGRLSAWKNSVRRKPLILRGARQVGKTFSVEQFGRAEFAQYVRVDLERNRDWHRIFDGSLAPRDLVAQLEVLSGKPISPRRTLLFFDEIQACPRAIMALRYFYEEMPDLHVMAAGSLLEFALSDISFPVGRVQFLEMHPMTFAEYLWAIGKESAADLVLGAPQALPASVHDMLLSELKKYCFVGGMPEAVRVYAETQSVQAAFAVHGELCETYRHDFSKYTPRCDPHCLDAVFKSVAREAGHQVKYARLAEGHDYRTAKKAFELLCNARIVKPVPAASISLPLGAGASANRFKALLLDVGLWQHLSGMRVEAEYAKEDLLDVYRGAMAEQFVGQEMTVSQGPELYYWSREAHGSSAEVDYLAVKEDGLWGVEVKSGSPGRIKSLRMLLDRFPACRGGIVLSSAPYSELPDQKLILAPLYFAFSSTLSAPLDVSR